ncbi:MAG: hypothetical protein HY072_06415, partial [Deltaproteobacteria bacterium]|nr:hypothetical protein [Deltaproteobacteria bacterium]
MVNPKNKILKLLSKLVVFILIFEIGLPSSYITNRSYVYANNPKPEKQNLLTFPVTSEPIQDFIEEKIKENGGELPPIDDFALNDPILDEDPFFMQSQNWVASLANENENGSENGDDEVIFSETEHSVSIQVKGLSQALVINQSLQPLLFNDQYVLLSAKENFSLFDSHEQTSGQHQSPGQGIFFLSVLEIKNSIEDSRPVPVYFFPLPTRGREWIGKVTAIETPSSDYFLLYDNTELDVSKEDKNEPLPIRFKDIETLHNAELLNVNFAQYSSLFYQIIHKKISFNPTPSQKDDLRLYFRKIFETIYNTQKIKEGKSLTQSDFKLINENIIGLQKSFIKSLGLALLRPLPGSTAGFGIYFTGLNKENSSYSFFDLDNYSFFNPEKQDHHKNNKHKNNKNETLPFFKLLKNNFFKLFSQFSPIQLALADGGDGPLLPDALDVATKDAAAYAATQAATTTRLVRIGTGAVVCAGAAILLKYTVFRKHFAILNAEKAKKGNTPRNVWQKLRREGKDSGDVFAYNMLFLDSLSSTFLGASVEWTLDRYFPQLAAGQNSLIRQILNRTIFYQRNIVRKIPVNWETFVKGFGIFGLLD